MRPISRRGSLAGMAVAAVAPYQFVGAQPINPPPPPSQDLSAINAAMRRLHQEGRYIPLYRLDQSASDDDQWASFWGDEDRALSKAAALRRPPPDLDGARAQDAMAVITGMAKDRQVVMLNEAHVCSRHRAFLGELVTALKPLGFTHLLCETFTNDPRLASIETFGAGRPLEHDQGYYTSDPVFAESVRLAAELGYRLAAYEQTEAQSDPKDRANVPRREQAQADNIAAIMKRFPEGKFLIHVGYSHLAERPSPSGVPWMAARLKADHGLDPLTISQAQSGSFAPHGQDSDWTKTILARFTGKRPIVVWDKDGGSVGARFDAADLAVIHPPLADVDGRPGWLAGAPSRRRVVAKLRDPRPIGPVLAQAVHAGEPDRAIPADQYVLGSGASELVFFLRPGRYRLRLETETGFIPVDELSV